MKTKYKYIEFTQAGFDWRIDNHRYKQYLGFLEWNKKWRCWEFVPADGTGFTQDCLEDIIDFIKQLESLS